ncbi:hypothetical protein WDV85_07945 [Pseudokineococcus sp. 5B2Z-1]|uniref:hypothetical protein n=1 Tax=Pseudokineococcus sp. 5B2Z-1 TaxID=3132744 RepID=UPI0030A35D2B
MDGRGALDVVEVRPGDPQRVLTLLPGRGYTPQAPLLHFTSSLLLERGWTVREVWWGRLPPTGDPETDARQALVEGERALRAVQAREHVVVAKSLGTRLLPVARELGLPGVWLTPLLREDVVRGALGAPDKPSLLVGGTADNAAWDPEVAEQARLDGWDVLEVPGADHSLELPGDARGSLRVLEQVLDRVEGLIGRLQR